MIPAIITAGLGVTGGIVGAIGAGKQRRKMGDYLSRQEGENQSWYDKEYYGDYTQRADTQALMKNLRENMQRQTQQAESTAAITGATPEAQSTVKENANKVISDTYSKIGAMGQAYKDSIMDQYMKRKDMFAGQRMGMMEGSANSYENLMSNSIGGAMKGLGSIFASDLGAGANATGFEVDSDTGYPQGDRADVDAFFKSKM